MKNRSQEPILSKKNLTLCLILHLVTTGKVAIIQERIKLFSNLYEIFRKRVKLIFFLLIFL